MINPDRVAFTLFGQSIYWYGILMATGIACAVAIAMAEAKRKNIHTDTVLDMCLVLIPSGIIGARLYYVLFELERYLANPLHIFYIWEGGLAIYGAVLGGLAGLLIYARKKKIRFLKLADLVAPGLVLAQAIGRWGNFFNQEAYGLPIENPDMLWFPFAVKIDGLHYFDAGNGLGPVLCSNPYHLATFFYESMWCLIVFAILWLLLRKRVKHDGDLLLWYALFYSAERMLLEGLRGDSLWLIDGVVRVSQALSLLMFAAALTFVLVRHFKEKKLGRLIWPSMEPSGEDEAAPEAELSSEPEEVLSSESEAEVSTESESDVSFEPETGLPSESETVLPPETEFESDTAPEKEGGADEAAESFEAAQAEAISIEPEAAPEENRETDE